MGKLKYYRFEWEECEIINGVECPINWGWDIVSASNYREAKKWIFENYSEFNINYIAEIKYERETK